jgi:phosphoribosylanthranilate isomerase
VGTVLTPGFSRSVDIPTARAVAQAAGLPLVILLVDPTLEEAVAAARETGASVVQLHGREEPETVARLRAAGPWSVWKAAPVRDAADARTALDRYGGVADGLLFDGWHEKLPGGTGTRFPWTSLAGIRDRFAPGQRFVAAGGLNAGNVAEAVSILRPHVVDASSGVERRVGEKDPAKVRGFVRAARLNGSGS